MKTKVFKLFASEWQIPENCSITEKAMRGGSGTYFEINISGNIYIVGSGSIENVLSLIENHLT